MPRSPRFDLAHVPQHIIQRGHDGEECFRLPADYRCYLAQLLHASRRWGCSVHAYVLMRNHVHLLVTPPRVGALASMMQAIGRNYVNYFNTMYRRSGTLWEGRYKSCLIGAEYVLTCQRYIESNPVRSGWVSEPLAYPWSSYGSNVLGASDPVVVPHAQYLALGQSSEQRAQAYRALFQRDIDPNVLRDIRAYVQQQRALGSPVFQSWVEATFGRHAKVRPAHRPRRQVEVEVVERGV
jgi:putative transposase